VARRCNITIGLHTLNEGRFRVKIPSVDALAHQIFLRLVKAGHQATATLTGERELQYRMKRDKDQQLSSDRENNKRTK